MTETARMRLRAEAVVTVDDAGRIFRPGTVDVVGDRITWVGATADAPPSRAEEVDVGGLLMPGLVNTHAHTPMTLLRSAGDGLPLERWLQEVIWPREARLVDEDVYWGMLLGADELLRCGVTTTCEMYLHNRAVVDAVAESGIRCVLTPGIFDLPDAGAAGAWPAFLEEAGQLFTDLHRPGGLLEVGLGPHSAYALPFEGLAATATLAADLGALVQVHVAETAEEVRTVEAAHGCSAPEVLRRAGILDARVLAAHSVWLSEADLDLYQRHDVAVAHCPGSNGKLGSGIAPVAAMLDRGLRVGLGTDGPASNDDLDLWEEMRLAPLLARAVAGHPGALTTGTALGLATRGGAEALGLAAGRLEAGRPADLIRLELDDSRFVPGDTELLAHLVWSASSRLVTDVWVAGRQVVAGGVCRTVDGRRARREVAARAARLAAG